MSINIVPLVKNKCGNLTDVNNYRAIVLCNIHTKVLEKIVLAEVSSYHACDDYQFGFKKDHSTTLCTAAVKQTITMPVVAVMCLYVSSTTPRLSTKSIIGNFLVNLLMMG